MIEQVVKAVLISKMGQDDMIPAAVAAGVKAYLMNPSLHATLGTIIVPPPVPPMPTTVGLPTFGLMISNALLS